MMNISGWFAALVDGLVGSRSSRRCSLWARASVVSPRVQVMEARCLLSGTSPVVPIYGPWCDASPDPALSHNETLPGHDLTAVYGIFQEGGNPPSPPDAPSPLGSIDGTVAGNIDGMIAGTEDGTGWGNIDGDGNINGAFDGTSDGTSDGTMIGTTDGTSDGTTQGNETTITITTTDAEAWEGPYTISRNDEAKFRLDRTGDSLPPMGVMIKFTGEATTDD